MPAPKAIALTALVPTEYDSISLGYTDGNLTTVTYSNKGSEVATLNLEYDGSNILTTVTRVQMAYKFNPFTGTLDEVSDFSAGTLQGNTTVVGE